MDQIITRHRHELKRRTLTVAHTSRVTPNMIRIVLHSDDLGDFVSLGADDHVKLFFPGTTDTPEMRDYTPRAYDNAAKTLTLDFAVHGEGPATQWAEKAVPGDRLNIGGPRGSAVVAPIFDWYLLIGDETALPAIGRWIEEMPAGTRVISLATVASEAEQQSFDTAAQHQPIWVHRPLTDGADPAALLDGLRNLTLPDGKGFIWIAAEAGVARAARDYVQSDLGHPKECLKAAGYWLQGESDAHQPLD